MRFFFVSDTVEHQYLKTLAEAHAYAKQRQRFEVRIEEVEVATDKDNMLRLLNEDGGTQQLIRTWQLTPRGGLQPIENGA